MEEVTVVGDGFSPIMEEEFYREPGVGGVSDPNRVLFEPAENIINAPPISFIIEGFLQRDGITGLVGKVAERKSIAAANVAHACLTGEDLFGRFRVVHPPERVLYLTPENGNSSMRDRFGKLGLIPAIASGKLKLRTLNTVGRLRLDDPELQTFAPGSVIIVDTLIRYLDGSDSDPLAIKDVVDCLFGLQRNGALAEIVLHHSTKMNTEEMSLANMIRGGGDLGAFLTSCHATKMHVPGDFNSLSRFKNIKPRDFESPEFDCTCDAKTTRMTAVDDKGLLMPMPSSKGFKRNRDGLETSALLILRNNTTLSSREVVSVLATQGIQRSATWVQRARARSGVGMRAVTG